MTSYDNKHSMIYKTNRHVQLEARTVHYQNGGVHIFRVNMIHSNVLDNFIAMLVVYCEGSFSLTSQTVTFQSPTHFVCKQRTMSFSIRNLCYMRISIKCTLIFSDNETALVELFTKTILTKETQVCRKTNHVYIMSTT